MKPYTFSLKTETLVMLNTINYQQLWTIVSGTSVTSTLIQVETSILAMFYNFSNRIDRISGINIAIKQYTFCNRDRTFERFPHIDDSIEFEGYYLNNISINNCIAFKLFQNNNVTSATNHNNQTAFCILDNIYESICNIIRQCSDVMAIIEKNTVKNTHDGRLSLNGILFQISIYSIKYQSSDIKLYLFLYTIIKKHTGEYNWTNNYNIYDNTSSAYQSLTIIIIKEDGIHTECKVSYLRNDKLIMFYHNYFNDNSYASRLIEFSYTIVNFNSINGDVSSFTDNKVSKIIIIQLHVLENENNSQIYIIKQSKLYLNGSLFDNDNVTMISTDSNTHNSYNPDFDQVSEAIMINAMYHPYN